MRKQRLILLSMVGLTFLSFVSAGCATGTSLAVSQWMSQRSLSPKAHQKLADGYRSEAVKLRKKADSHTEMLSRVGKDPSWSSPREREAWMAHCEFLIKKYSEAAEAADALAEEHEAHAQGLEGLKDIR